MIKNFRASTLKPRSPELQTFVDSLMEIRNRERDNENPPPRSIYGLSSDSTTVDDAFELSPGLIVLTVPTRGGKTTFLRNVESAFANQHPSALLWSIAVDEPIKDGLPFLSARAMFATDFASDETITRIPDVILIDSLRLLPFELEGGLRSGAVAASLFAFLTELTVIASHFGIAIIAAFNPMVADTDKSTLDSDIESSTMAVAKLKDYNTLSYASRAASSRQTKVIDISSGIKIIQMLGRGGRFIQDRVLPSPKEVYSSTAFSTPQQAAAIFNPADLF